MIFEPTQIQGVVSIAPERRGDHRGWLARTFCTDEFTSKGLPTIYVQCTTTFTAKKGTVRGMHFQATPRGEDKIVRCTRGIILDVSLDLRSDSSTFRQHHTQELSAKNGSAVFIPKGLAHGFQALTDDVEVFYMMTVSFHPDSVTGVRWDDLAFDISWPLPITDISDKDKNWPDFEFGRA